MKNFNTILKELNACQPAQDWAKDKSIEEVIDTCHRGDWLLWLAKKINVPLKTLTLAKVKCAQTVIYLMKDERSLKALEVAEKFALTDEVTLDDLCFARKNADAANAANAAANAANAADAAAYAARTKNQLQTANICKEILGNLIIEIINKQLKQSNNE